METTEFLFFAAVATVAVGPKSLPVYARAAGAAAGHVARTLRRAQVAAAAAAAATDGGGGVAAGWRRGLATARDLSSELRSDLSVDLFAAGGGAAPRGREGGGLAGLWPAPRRRRWRRAAHARPSRHSPTGLGVRPPRRPPVGVGAPRRRRPRRRGARPWTAPTGGGVGFGVGGGGGGGARRAARVVVGRPRRRRRRRRGCGGGGRARRATTRGGVVAGGWCGWPPDGARGLTLSHVGGGGAGAVPSGRPRCRLPHQTGARRCLGGRVGGGRRHAVARAFVASEDRGGCRR
ncbi:hypothetical protein BU14_0290s0003 [Porphyra umbilicalis]|uniref:Uncharacterized protein n=1 Tax=Porphyra umbilicalis TaxID=2786 RepID=A0A1X6P0U5_PORUM|nr:hypothetical protein BU14_0290s0003 [Porphyra umbilicalis]|eukprot:OSX74395.1 hypothetical protein BU14_0290s0003 [Porphyra umbilicalis]